jgi:hypothetical protein
MPRYDAQNLAAVNPEFRKEHGIGRGGNSTNDKFRFSKVNAAMVASGRELMTPGLTLRLMPLYNGLPGDPDRQFVRFREGPGGAIFGDWSRMLTCAFWVGNPGACFILHDGNPMLNIYDNPYFVLRNVAWNNRENPDIGRLFVELLDKAFVKDSHVGSLKKPDPILFVSASTVLADDHGRPFLGAFGEDKKKQARIVGLKGSAAAALYDALNVADDHGQFMAGDMLAERARLVTILPDDFRNATNRNSHVITTAGPGGAQLPAYIQQQSPVIFGRPPKPSSMTHNVVIHETYNGQELPLTPYAERLANESLSFDEYLWVPSYVEQAEILATRFPRPALEFAWREHPEYLRCIPTGRTTSYADPEDSTDAPPPKTSSAFTRPGPAPGFSAAAAPQASLPSAPWDAPAPAAVAPWETPANAAESLSSAEAARLSGMFGGAVPPGATTAPPSVTLPQAATPAPAAPRNNFADVLAKARNAKPAGN